MSCGLADLPPHQTFINNAVLSSEETCFSWLVSLLPGMNSSVSMVFPFDNSSFPSWLFPVQCEIPWLVKSAGCMELLIRTTRAASSGWRGEFLPGLFSFSQPQTPAFWYFWSQFIYPLQQIPDSPRPPNYRYPVPWCPNVTHTFSDHAFWFLVPKMWSPWMTSLNDL